MAVTFSKHPASMTVMEGKIKASLSVTAAGATSYQWKKAKSATSTESAEVVPSKTATTFDVPADLPVGEHYYFCAASDADSTVNSNIATITVVDFPEYITGNFVHNYIDQCAEEVKTRFTELQTRRGVTIPKDDNALRTVQIELFMDAL